MALGVAACAPCPPLAEVPVRGGTEAQRALAEETLAEMADALALPVCVDRVRFGGWAPFVHKYGSYSTVTHRVSVEPAANEDEVPIVVRHEVCHAVDTQNDVVDGRKDVFVLADPETGEDLYRPGREPFAVLCAYGAAALAPLWDAECVDDPDLRGAQIVRHEVYGFEDPPAVTLGAEVGFAYGDAILADDVVEGLDFLRTTGDNLYLGISAARGSRWVYTWRTVDPRTGARVADEDPVDELEPRLDPWWQTEDADGVEDVWAVDASLLLPQGAARRWMVFDGAQWRPTDRPCARDLVPFAVRGQVWAGWIDEEAGELRWAPWELDAGG